MKTIGILGGISPQATMDFERRIHKVSQRIIPQHGNSGYPPMLVYYHRCPPVFTKDGIAPVLPIQADPDLLGLPVGLEVKQIFSSSPQTVHTCCKRNSREHQVSTF
jgi:hypothetical protein